MTLHASLLLSFLLRFISLQHWLTEPFSFSSLHRITAEYGLPNIWYMMRYTASVCNWSAVGLWRCNIFRAMPFVSGCHGRRNVVCHTAVVILACMKGSWLAMD